MGDITSIMIRFTILLLLFGGYLTILPSNNKPRGNSAKAERLSEVVLRKHQCRCLQEMNFGGVIPGFRGVFWRGGAPPFLVDIGFRFVGGVEMHWWVLLGGLS